MRGPRVETQAFNIARDASRLLWHFKRHSEYVGSTYCPSSRTKEEAVKPKEGWYYSYNGLSYDIQMMNYFERTVVAKAPNNAR